MPERTDAGESNPAVGGDTSVRAEIVLVASIGLGILVAIAVLALFSVAPDELTALGVGLLVALALDPVLRATQRRFDCSRVVGTLIVASGFAVVLGGVVLVLGPQAAEQANQFATELPETIEDFYSWPVIGQRLEEADAVGRVEQFVDDLPSRIDADSIENIADRVLGGLGTALLVLITASAVLLDGGAIVERIRRTIPPDRRDRADEIGRIVYQSVARYFAGSVGVAILAGIVILTAGLVLGVPLAPLAAVWAAITNLIPQVGGFLGGAFFVVLATTAGPLTGLLALAVFLVYQQVEHNLIAPTVIGRAVNLTPPTTMLAALIGGAAAGVPGAIIATPMVGAIKSVWLDTKGQRHDTDDGETGDDDEDSDDDPNIFQRIKNKLTGSTDG